MKKSSFFPWAAALVLLGAALLLSGLAGICAAEQFPKSTWEDRPDPLASPQAQKGGVISVFGGQYPKSMNYYLDNNMLSAEIFGTMFESLLSIHPITLEYQPAIADRWEISEDKKTFTFHIDKDAHWSDGRPVTARDVAWTYEAIMDPKHMTGPHKVSLERFKPPEVIDRRTIRFIAKSVHWKNLLTLGGLNIMAKHAYAEKDFNKINFSFPVISGPYRPGEMQEGRLIRMKRRKNWWQGDFAGNRNKYNFDTITFKFYAERENAFEAFKKGKIDLFPVYTSRIWVKETNGDAFFKNHILRRKIHNHNPVGFQGFAMNMRRAPFDDVRVRKAMALLLDRQEMNRTLMYNQYFLHRSYYEDLYTRDNPCPNPVIEMDKEAARKLLDAAGWQVNPETGFREKEGRELKVHFLTRNASSEKFLSIYAEDLKDAGIKLVIDKKDWAAWARDMDEFNFQMTWAAWGASMFKDPEGMWFSEEADRKSGSNITGFKNEAVDRLIEKQKSIFSVEKRNEICRQIDQIVFDDFPYVLLWNIDYTRLLYWNKFGTPETVLSKYGDEMSALWYWWWDPDAAAILSDAVKHGFSLPPAEPSVHFDEVFSTAERTSP
ncbi:MAG: ABC transporter substrate-binding protein [Desulfobacterales bacterium]|nr:ABC transporter substrate-binding protein [Desulfobacterales bacterium]